MNIFLVYVDPPVETECFVIEFPGTKDQVLEYVRHHRTGGPGAKYKIIPLPTGGKDPQILCSQPSVQALRANDPAPPAKEGEEEEEFLDPDGKLLDTGDADEMFGAD